MDLRSVGIVYRKELRETLRDRRTLIVMVVLPLCLYPVVGIGITQWIGAHEAKREQESSRVGLRGPSWGPLEQALREAKHVDLRRDGATEAALRRGELDLLLQVPAGHEEALAGNHTVKLRVTYDETEDRSRLARRRVNDVVRSLARDIVRARLRSRHLPPTLVKPLETAERHVTGGRDRAAHMLAGTIPLLVILMVLLGAFYPAIDVTAGEKERGTLETLLVAPVDRTSLIAGKYLVVASTAVFTGVLNLGSIGLTLALGFGPALRAAGVGSQGLPWAAVALTVVAMVPAALFFAATMIAIAALGRSFKEAQNLLTPVYMVCMLPALAAQLPGVELTPLTALLPVVNVSLLTRDLIAGDAAWLPAVLTIGSVLLFTAVALKLAARIFESERLLFAPDPGAGARQKLWSTLLGRSGTGAQRASSSQAALLFMVVMALIVLVGQPLQSRHLIGGLLVTEWLLIGLPVLALVRLGRLAPRTTLALRRAGPAALLGAVLAGVSAWYLVGVLVEMVQQRVLPMPEEMIRRYQEALFSTDRSLGLDLIALALSPAVCEELLFRGVVLQATRQTMSARWAILLNGLLFGLFHMSPYRFVSTALLGALLALIVLRSGSILPGIVFHFLNNASAIVAGRLLGETPRPDVSGTALSWPLLAASLVVFVLGMSLAIRAGPSAPRDPAG